MDSFTIKYDLNDLLSKKSDELTDTEVNKTTNSNCICGRLANLFSSLLKNDNENNNNDKKQPKQENDNKIDSINNELKLLRKYQSDLTNKFNLILNKLDNNLLNSTKSILHPPTLAATLQPHPQIVTNTNGSNIHKQQTASLLTGAKKRKFNPTTTATI